MPRLSINGQAVEAAPGETVLASARSAGITIPTLCYHPALSAVGSCRLCVVEVSGLFEIERPACTLAAADGMRVVTESLRLARHRRFVLESLLQHYVPDDARRADDSLFLHWARQYGAEFPADVQRRYPVDADPHPLLRIDMNQCILCTRCVRVCAEVQGRCVWHLAGRGADTHPVPGLGTDMLAADCESCGACAHVCPTGAISDRAEAAPAERSVTTTCGYCGVGCQFDLEIAQDRIVRVAPNEAAPVNGLSLCVKGRYGYDYVHHPDRLTRPRVREYLLQGEAKRATAEGVQSPWIDVDWPTALRLTAERLERVRRESGPGALAFLASAKCTNEENYLLQKLARQVFGTNNIDHCARLCHSSTVTGLALSFGSGAMSNSMDDVAQQAAAIFVIGSNTTEQHPVFGAMLRQAALRRGCRIVVADPRRIDLVDFATMHLRHRPGTDIALVNGLMHIMLREGWHDAAFIAARCENFEPFAASLADYTPERVARQTGVAEWQLRAAAELLAKHKPMATIWAMGITQHISGVMNVLALANLQMLLGNMGVPGGGVNPLRGQNNVQGACDMGALPNLLPGYRAVSDTAAWAALAPSWGPNIANSVLTSPGLTVTEMLNAAMRGAVRALYIMGENPALTEPDSNHARASLAAAELLVLQEILPSETSAYADILLPGESFAEKDGTFTNTERRVQLVRRAVPPPGDARDDWQIIAAVANEVLDEPWHYASPAEIMEEIASVTPSYAGIRHRRLAAGERLQWPVPSLEHSGTRILHQTAFTRGKGRFHAVEDLPPAELPDAEFPLLLTTGRVLYHWHGGELTRRVAGLLALCDHPLVEIHPEDAVRWRIRDEQAIALVSRRGRMEALAFLTDRVAPGVLFANFHFPGTQNANNLTQPAVDPLAKIPEYKVCAVRFEPLEP